MRIGKVDRNTGVGGKPLVLVRAIVIGAVFPASDDPDRWPNDLEIFMKVMCFDNAGMWKRKTGALPADLCYPEADETEREALFADFADFADKGTRWKPGARSDRRQSLERRVFDTFSHTQQREYCCRLDEIDGPPDKSWPEINAYLGTSASTLPELVQQLSQQRYGRRLRLGDAFSGIGSIPLEAIELGCDV